MRHNVLAFVVLSVLIGLMSACVSVQNAYVPVSDVTLIERLPTSGVHRVLAKETLYSIAWRYGLDYQYLAKRNHIKPPYSIRVGQMIYLTTKPVHRPLKPKKHLVKSVSIVCKKTTMHKAHLTKKPQHTVAIHRWQWPATGRLNGEFSTLNKGINISGHLGDPVFSAASGKVVYSGSGLRSYGNLIIIKHDSTFLTAYAHNDKIFVKEGQWIKMGQKIAEMGNTGTQTVRLHFEIRRNGRPVNPLIYLTKKI